MVMRLSSPGWMTFLGDDDSCHSKIVIATHAGSLAVTQPGSAANDQRLFRVCHGRLTMAAEGVKE
jgi:hypothetical protein